MKSLFIVILLVICLHVISSLAEYKFYDPWILTKIAGKKMRPGQKVTLKIRSMFERTVLLKIRRHDANFFNVLAENVKLKVGYNYVKVKIPSGDFATPSSQNYISIESGLILERSASFQIGDPGFGLTIRKTVSGYIIKVGNTLEASWKGSYVPPGVDPSTFNDIFCSFFPVRFLHNVAYRYKYFENGVDFNITTGGLNYTIPLDTVPDTLYKINCYIGNNINQTGYSSGSFLKVHEDLILKFQLTFDIPGGNDIDGV
ncbi:hypothetical protein Glove_66g88 [Diversispora epigaea]|uniref:Uncharacterized protein n=1 Tax=Diversispora epigaea TaxID=1348612 RepID=A0A397JJU0_9GLOM|nr:hypothetical protein Glove_66g88 [Diversispora epigaea]